MESETILTLHSRFEQTARKESTSGVEFWRARDLQILLGYAQWRNFKPLIDKAMTACRTSGFEVGDYFARVRKMVGIGSETDREVEDWILTRYACYLIARNGDSRKEQIAFAQTYFAVQTRKMEVIVRRIAETERVLARKKPADSEKVLAGVIFERLRNEKSFGVIRSKGDQALFGGRSTQRMKETLGIAYSFPLCFVTMPYFYRLRRRAAATPPDEVVRQNSSIPNSHQTRNGSFCFFQTVTVHLVAQSKPSNKIIPNVPMRPLWNDNPFRR